MQQINRNLFTWTSRPVNIVLKFIEWRCEMTGWCFSVKPVLCRYFLLSLLPSAQYDYHYWRILSQQLDLIITPPLGSDSSVNVKNTFTEDWLCSCCWLSLLVSDLILGNKHDWARMVFWPIVKTGRGVFICAVLANTQPTLARCPGCL